MLRNYDPGRVVVTFNGVRLVGYQDGTFVSAERAEDGFTMQVGSGGDVTRTRNRNKTGTITLTLQQASPSNDVLSNFAELDEALGLSFGSIMIKDLQGTTLCEAADAWIKKFPTVEYAKESGPRVWMFDCAELFIYAGGQIV